MGDTGLEHKSLGTCNDNELEGAVARLGAESGAVAAETPAFDSDLAAVMEAWPNLPDVVRVGIMAMVRASGSGG